MKGAAELLGIKSLAKDWGRHRNVKLKVDAKATIGMVHRSGLGKLRHVEVGNLWIHQAVRTKRIGEEGVGHREPSWLVHEVFVCRRCVASP